MRHRNPWIFVIALLTALSHLPICALEPVSKIIDQADAPLKIVKYEAVYREGSGRYSREGIYHSVEYENVSGRIVEAVQIGLVSFDVWNEFLDRTGGIALEVLGPNTSKKGTWITGRYRGFTFLTGVAYVSKVRFHGGEIWKVDLDAIAEELAKIEDGFDVNRLTQREENEE